MSSSSEVLDDEPSATAVMEVMVPYLYPVIRLVLALVVVWFAGGSTK